MKKVVTWLTAAIVFGCVSTPLSVFAVSYAPGATLNPTCLPTDASCVVDLSLIASSTSGTINATSSLTISNLNGVLQAVNGLVSALANGSNGQVLKMSGGALSWGTDIFGSGGGSSVFATTSDSLAVFPASLATVFLLGQSATTTTGNIFEALGNTLLRGTLTLTGNSNLRNAYSANFYASSTNASTTNTNALTVGTLSGPLQAVNGAVSATSTISTAYGGTGISSITNNQLLIGGANNAYAQIATSALGLTTTNVSEGTNQYFTNSRVATVIAGTTTTALAEGNNLYYTQSRVAGTIAGTTTTALAEGTNQYFTNARADARINATSSIGTLTSAPNLSSVGTISSGTFSGTIASIASISGASLTMCNGTLDKLTYNSTTKQFGCGTDQSGSGGSDVNWTFFNGSALRPATTSNQVLIGTNATSTNSKLEVVGGATIDAITSGSFYSDAASIVSAGIAAMAVTDAAIENATITNATATNLVAGSLTATSAARLYGGTVTSNFTATGSTQLASLNTSGTTNLRNAYALTLYASTTNASTTNTASLAATSITSGSSTLTGTSSSAGISSLFASIFQTIFDAMTARVATIYSATIGSLTATSTSNLAATNITSLSASSSAISGAEIASNATIGTGAFGTISATGSTALASTTLYGRTIIGSLISTSTASSTFANGINITSGCLALNGTCLSTGGTSLTGSTGQLAYFSGINSAVGTSSIFLSTAGNVGIGTTSPSQTLSVAGNVYMTGTMNAGDLITKGSAIDVRAFGAVGNGTADDTVAIQAAINYAAAYATSTEGPIGKVIAPSGYKFKTSSSLTISVPMNIDFGSFIEYSGTSGAAIIIGAVAPSGGRNTGYNMHFAGLRATNGNTAQPTSVNSSGSSGIEIRNMQFSNLTVDNIIAFTKYGIFLNGTNNIYSGQHIQDNTINLGSVAYNGAGLYAESVNAATGAVQVNTINLQNSFTNFVNLQLGTTGDNNTNNNIVRATALDAPATGGTTAIIHGWYNDLTLGYHYGTTLLSSDSRNNKIHILHTQATGANVSDNGTGNVVSYMSDIGEHIGSSAFSILDSGFVGIGTTSPGSLLALNNVANFTSATSTFYASGGINLAAGCFSVNGTCISGSGGGGSGTVNSGTQGQLGFYNSAGTAISGTSTLSLATNGNFSIGSSHTLLSAKNTSGNAYINADGGNLGIGLTSPTMVLDIFGGTLSGTTIGSTQNLSQTAGSANGSNNIGLKTLLYRHTGGSDWTGTALRLQQYVDSTNMGYIDFNPSASSQDIAFGTNGNELVRISSSGNVGIGVSNPDNPLTVFGSGAALSLENGTGGNLTFGTVAGGFATADVSGANAFAINTNSSERLRVTSGGSVGIGTTSPARQLTTTGTVQFANFSAGTLQTDANGVLSVSSDERLKNIDGNFSRGLADILKINPITFHWNATSGMDMANTYTGFSAQNVQSAIPEAVGSSSSGMLSLSDRPILAALVNAFKDLGATIVDGVTHFAKLAVGIFTADSIATKELCALKSDGSKVCVTGDQLANVLSSGGGSSDSPSAPVSPTTPLSNNIATTTPESAPSSPSEIIPDAEIASSSASDFIQTSSTSQAENISAPGSQ